MGDVIEITTWPSNRNIFYRISSSGLIFEVKGRDSAVIGLSKKLDNYCDYWVVIGQNHHTWIRKEGSSGKSIRTPQIITNAEYRKFWLSWRNGCIQLGRCDNRPGALLSFNHNTELNYITFASNDSIGNNEPIQWRFELPPLLEKPILKPVTGGELQWVAADNQLPDGALIGGYERETLYIIRAPHRGSLTPGKFVPSKGLGFISWGSESHEKMNFEVLCGFDCTWVTTTEDRIPVGAVEGGYSENHEREKLYVGRALYGGHLIPGKVQPSHKVCYIAFDTKEIGVKKFEILVSPFHNIRCANKILMPHIDTDNPPESDEDDESDVDMIEEIEPDEDDGHVILF